MCLWLMKILTQTCDVDEVVVGDDVNFDDVIDAEVW